MIRITPRTAALSALLTLFWPAAPPTAAAPKPDLGGVWVLNVEDSQDPFEIMRDRLDRRRRVYVGGLPGGPTRRPPSAQPRGSLGGKGLREPDAGVDRLEIELAEPRVVIRFADGLERVFFTDGRPPTDDFEIGLLAASARWKRGQLVFTAESAYGGKLKEVYALSPDGTRLTVKITREGAGNEPGISFERVYDRADSWEAISTGDEAADPNAPESP